MKCPICGKQTLPGAKLCGPCRAALKRAKDDSVWVMPPGSAARTGAESVDADTPAVPPVPGTRLGGWRGVGMGVAALFVAAGGLATVRLVQVEEPSAYHRPPPATVQPATTSAPTVPQVLDLPAVARTSSVAPHATPAVDGEPAPARPRDRTPRPRLAPEPPPAPAPVMPEAPPPEPLPAPFVERAPPPKPVDPWQRMSESLARCAGQELFARLACEHRVRATSCDGNWGRVPQCPGGLPADHGQ